MQTNRRASPLVPLFILPTQHEKGDGRNYHDTAQTDKTPYESCVIDRSWGRTENNGANDISDAVSNKGRGADSRFF